MPKKEFHSNQQKQLLRVQISELEHLPVDRKVFKSMGTVLIPADRDDLLDELSGKEEQIIAQQSVIRK